eukprot:IDg3980t1
MYILIYSTGRVYDAAISNYQAAREVSLNYTAIGGKRSEPFSTARASSLCTSQYKHNGTLCARKFSVEAPTDCIARASDAHDCIRSTTLSAKRAHTSCRSLRREHLPAQMHHAYPRVTRIEELLSGRVHTKTFPTLGVHTSAQRFLQAGLVVSRDTIQAR